MAIERLNSERAEGGNAMLAALYITTGLWASYTADLMLAARKLVAVRPGLKLGWWFWLLVAVFLGLLGFWHGCHVLLMPAHLYAINAIGLRTLAFIITIGAGHLLAKKLAKGPEEFVKRITRIPPKKVGAIALIIALTPIILVHVGLPLLGRWVGFNRATHILGVLKVMGPGDITLFPEIDPE